MSVALDKEGRRCDSFTEFRPSAVAENAREPKRELTHIIYGRVRLATEPRNSE